MRIRSLLILCVLVIGMVIIALPAWIHAQEKELNSDQLALAVANAQKANQAAIAKYSWRVKTKLSSGGEEKATSINEMRFNTDGELESTNIGGESKVEKKRGLRGRMQRSKMEDAAKYIEAVLDQAFKYIFMSKGTLVDAFDRGELNKQAGSIEYSGQNLFAKADSLRMSIDPDDNLITRLEFTTTLEEDVIRGLITMKRIEGGGPNKPVTLDIEVPVKGLKIESETYDWIEQK